VREIACEVTKKSHEEVLKAIDKKFHIIGDREMIRCPYFMGKHLANECPHQKPHAPLNPRDALSTATFAESTVMVLMSIFSMQR